MKVQAYVIRHFPDRRPEGETVMGLLPDGKRALADIYASSAELEQLREQALEGRTGKVRFEPAKGRNFIRLYLKESKRCNSICCLTGNEIA